MIKNYIKIAFRNVKHHKAFTFLNMTGLSIGLACCILLLLYIQFELSFDTFHQNSDRIYRVIREGKALTPSPLGPKLMDEIPEIELAARFIKQDNIRISYFNKIFLEDDFYWADQEILDIFTIPFISGNPNTVLSNPFSIVVSERIAKKFFNDDDPIGEVLSVGSGKEFIITGVYADIPDNSHFNIDFIAPYITYFELTGNEIDNWFRNFTYTYLLLHEGTDPKELDSKFPAVVDRFLIDNLPLEVRNNIPKPVPRIFYLQALSRIHLYSNLRQEISANNDIKYIFLFSSVALMILLIACINYVNLTTARATRRAKEIGIRKVSGARRKHIIYQFLAESLLFTVLAMLISVTILQLALPAFNNLVDRQLQFSPESDPQLFLGLIILIVFVGIISGTYPALRLSGFKPISVLKGVFTKSKRGLVLRNLLVVAQFSITIFLIICTLVIRNQLSFVKETNVGYTKDQIVTIPVRNREINQEIDGIKSELLRSASILDVSTSARLPNNIDTFTSADWPGKNPDLNFAINYNTADYDFIKLYDIEIIRGRNFSKDFPSDLNGAFLINEAAVEAAQFKNPIGQEFLHWRGDTGKIVGVMKNFHLRSLHYPIEPLYIYLDPHGFSYISVKIMSDDIPATMTFIESVIKKYSPNYPFEYSFFDELFDKSYHSEQQMVNIFSSFTVLAIIISCMGLFGLILYSLEHRIKEIGIRKILGGSVPGIMLLLLKEFIKWVLISNIIAWPLSWFIMNKWLQNFAYKTEIFAVNFLIAAGIALIIALLTMSYQSIKAALSNPVKALRYE